MEAFRYAKTVSFFFYVVLVFFFHGTSMIEEAQADF